MSCENNSPALEARPLTALPAVLPVDSNAEAMPDKGFPEVLAVLSLDPDLPPSNAENPLSNELAELPEPVDPAPLPPVRPPKRLPSPLEPLPPPKRP